MLGYNENGEEELALEMFTRIQPDGWAPNYRTFIAALKACTGLALKEEGRQVDGKVIKVESLKRGTEIHKQAAERGFDSEMFLASTLVDMYSKCGSIDDARIVFNKMPRHDLVSWTGMLLGYAENGQEELALQFFSLLPRENFLPDAVAYVAALRACTSLAVKEEGKLVNGRCLKVVALEKGRVVHSQAAKSRCELDTFVASTLIDFYAKCGVLEDARRIFDRVIFGDVLLWNSLMQAYAENGEGQLALEAFVFLKPESCSPNGLSFVEACTSLAATEEATLLNGRPVKREALEKGMIIHSKSAKLNVDSDGMPLLTVVSWTALLLGYSDSNQPEVALEMFNRMRAESSSFCSPDALTFVAALKACGSSASALMTKLIHGELCRNNDWIDRDELVVTSLVDAYGKCGNMSSAQRVFDGLRKRDRVSYTALLAGFSRDGDAERVLELYSTMIEDGLRPNDVTYICLLNACSHAGLVEEGKRCFKEMVEVHGIRPGIEHYSCMLDLLGRANRVEEALKVVREMKVKANVVVWKTLLAACKAWKNTGIGKIAFESLLEIEDNDPAAYVLMASIYERE